MPLAGLGEGQARYLGIGATDPRSATLFAARAVKRDDELWGYAVVVLDLEPLLVAAKQAIDEGLTMAVHVSRPDGDYWLGDSDAGIIRFNMKFGETLNNRLKVTYIAGNTEPPAMVKLATILMVVRNASRAALNDENCLDRIKDMWMNLQSSVQSELDFILRELAKEKLVGVATFGNSGAY